MVAMATQTTDLKAGLLPHQSRLFDLVFGSRVENAGLIGGYGCGKTVAGARMAVALAHANPGLDGLYSCLDYPILIDAIIPVFEQELGKLGFVEGVHYRLDARQVCTFFTAKNSEGQYSRVLFRPVDGARNLRKIVSANYAWAVKDESGLYTEETHRKIDERVRHGLASRRVKVDVTTPEGLGPLYDRYVTDPRKRAAAARVDGRLCDDEPNRLVRGRTMDNPYLAPEYVESLLSQYDDHLVASYLEGHFVPMFEGRCFRFTEHEHVTFEASYDPHLPIGLAWDFNVNPMSVTLNHYHKGKLWTFDEIVLSSSHTEDVCHEFVSRYGAHVGGLRIYGDAGGRSRSTKTRWTDYDIISDLLGHFPNYGENVPSTNPGQRESINTFNALLRNGHGVVSYSIHPSCVQTIKSLLTTVYDDKGQIYKAPDSYEHLTDGLRYIAWQVAPIDTVLRRGKTAERRGGLLRV